MALKKILIPVDGSDNSERITDWVVGLAQPLGSSVEIITVVDPSKIELPESSAEHGHPIPGRSGQYDRRGVETSGALAGGTGIVSGVIGTPGRGLGVEHASGFGTQILDQVMEQATEYVRRVSSKVGDSGISTNHIALAGDPAEEILSHSKKINADLVAMATHRGSAIARGVLGSITDTVLRSSEIPVLAIHPENLNSFSGSQGKPETVVVPLDGSDRSASVVDLALELSAAVDAEIAFFQAVDAWPYVVTPMEASYQSEYAVSSRRQRAEDYLEQFLEKARSSGVKARSIVVAGSAAASLLDELNLLSAPLIVMSTRGSSRFKRWILGSVSDKVVRSSGLPVIVVPPNE